jgi:hypothetical protein
MQAAGAPSAKPGVPRTRHPRPWRSVERRLRGTYLRNKLTMRGTCDKNEFDLLRHNHGERDDPRTFGGGKWQAPS